MFKYTDEAASKWPRASTYLVTVYLEKSKFYKENQCCFYWTSHNDLYNITGLYKKGIDYFKSIIFICTLVRNTNKLFIALICLCVLMLTLQHPVQHVWPLILHTVLNKDLKHLEYREDKKILSGRLQELKYSIAITCITDSKPFLSEALFVRILTNKIGVGFCSSLERKSWMLQQGHFNHEW